MTQGDILSFLKRRKIENFGITFSLSNLNNRQYFYAKFSSNCWHNEYAAIVFAWESAPAFSAGESLIHHAERSSFIMGLSAGDHDQPGNNQCQADKLGRCMRFFEKHHSHNCPDRNRELAKCRYVTYIGNHGHCCQN